MSEEKKENAVLVPDTVEQPNEKKKIKKSLTSFIKWHECGQQSRVFLLIVGYVLMIVMMCGFPLYHGSEVRDFSVKIQQDFKEAEKNHGNSLAVFERYSKKESPMTCLVYLTPEDTVILETEKKQEKGCTQYTAVWDMAAVKKVNDDLTALKAELQQTDSFKKTGTWSLEERSFLRERLTDKILQSWKDLVSRGIVKESFAKDGDVFLVGTTIEVEGYQEPTRGVDVLTIDQMVDLMTSNVDPWAEHYETYEKLFREILKPTLINIKGMDIKQVKKDETLTSGTFILKKGQEITENGLSLFLAYSTSYFGDFWWARGCVRLLVFVICIWVFWYVLEKYNGGKGSTQCRARLDIMYSYFPMLALLLGLVSNYLLMEIILSVLLNFPKIAEKFPIDYLYVIYPMLLPTLLISITYRYDINISLFTGLFFAVLYSTISITGTYSIVLVGFCSSVGCILFAKRINTLRKLFKYTSGIQITCVLISLSLDWVFELTRLHQFEWSEKKIWILVTAFAFAVITTFVIAPFGMIIMEMFGADTRPIYNELGSMSNPLMSTLAEQAPGTFYHCVKVANMAAFAAEEMSDDFDPVVIRACAMFHDIGKLKDPGRFMENGGEMLRKDYDSYMDMSQTLIRHVTDGVDLANAKKLPHLIREVIRTHHGNSTQKYFLSQAIECKEVVGDDFDKQQFSYPAENPTEPEAFLIGMADACEAAVNGAMRSGNYNEKDSYEKMIQQKVAEVFAGRQKDNFMENAHVKISDLTIMRNMFIKHLSGQFKRSNKTYDKTKAADAAAAAKQAAVDSTAKDSVKA